MTYSLINSGLSDVLAQLDPNVLEKPLNQLRYGKPQKKVFFYGSAIKNVGGGVDKARPLREKNFFELEKNVSTAITLKGGGLNDKAIKKTEHYYGSPTGKY